VGIALGVTFHRLGFAVKVLGEGGLPSHDARRWQSEPHLRVSLAYLRAILERLDQIDVRMYRMATALAPYASHPDLPAFHGQLRECAQELAEVGDLARRYSIRLSSHPGQYTVLNSERVAVVEAAVRDLEIQAELFDALGLGAEGVVVVHVGGASGGRSAALERFCRGWERLSPAAQRRVVVENDVRTFGLSDVLELHQCLGVRVVWDALHHLCHDPAGIAPREALALALDTWPREERPKIHFSSPRLDAGVRLPQLRAHADLLDPVSFENFLLYVAEPVGRDFDVMLEAKAKDLALLRLREQLQRPWLTWKNGQLEVKAHGKAVQEREERKARRAQVARAREEGVKLSLRLG
jgi:UV DNA damage endonuclease